MEFDDDELDDLPGAPLLPAEDRLWRHPSEVATQGGGTAGGGRRPRRARARRANDPSLLTVVALTSSISVVMTLAVVAVVRPVRTQLAVEQIAAPTGDGSAVHAATDVAAIADRLRAAVASISATRSDGTHRGSGVIYRTDGHILTAHHLVTGASSVAVTLDDGREVPAKVIGSDAETDIAVLDADGDGFSIAPLGSATGVRAGQAAITLGTAAEGSPAAVVSVGVVSAIGQAVTNGGRRLVDMIQTDTVVAPGSAGGAVVDGAGVVIGIATVNGESDGSTTGFATPIDVARLVASQLITHGKITRGWLGVEGEDVTATRAKDLGVRSGVVVKNVKDGSPAADGGLRPSDVVIDVDGEAVASMTALVVELRTRRPGDAVTVGYLRGDERRTARITLGEKPSH